MQLADLNVSALDNFIKGYFKLSNEVGLNDGRRVAIKISLDDIKKIYPVKGMDIRGDLTIDMKTKGRYIPQIRYTRLRMRRST